LENEDIQVSRLLFSLAEKAGIKIIDDIVTFEEPGLIVEYKRRFFIIICRDLNTEDRNTVLGHELGHYFLGHLKEKESGAFDIQRFTAKEKEATTFGRRLLAVMGKGGEV
jgi:Zn-dependent peptidase ImmA (M78 family)